MFAGNNLRVAVEAAHSGTAARSTWSWFLHVWLTASPDQKPAFPRTVASRPALAVFSTAPDNQQCCPRTHRPATKSTSVCAQAGSPGTDLSATEKHLSPSPTHTHYVLTRAHAPHTTISRRRHHRWMRSASSSSALQRSALHTLAAPRPSCEDKINFHQYRTAPPR